MQDYKKTALGRALFFGKALGKLPSVRIVAVTLIQTGRRITERRNTKQVILETALQPFSVKATPADEVLKIALSHQNRGADISKIVVGAENTEQQMPCMKTALWWRRRQCPRLSLRHI